MRRIFKRERRGGYPKLGDKLVGEGKVNRNTCLEKKKDKARERGIISLVGYDFANTKTFCGESLERKADGGDNVSYRGGNIFGEGRQTKTPRIRSALGQLRNKKKRGEMGIVWKERGTISQVG